MLAMLNSIVKMRGQIPILIATAGDKTLKKYAISEEEFDLLESIVRILKIFLIPTQKLQVCYFFSILYLYLYLSISFLYVKILFFLFLPSIFSFSTFFLSIFLTRFLLGFKISYDFLFSSYLLPFSPRSREIQ